MNRYLLLTKIMLKGGEMANPEDEQKKKAYKILGTFAMLGIMIPCCILVAFMVFIMTQALMEAGGNTEALIFVVQIMSVFSIVFSIMVIFNTLYFSSDLGQYLAFPIKPGVLVAAKFTQAYVAESVMEFIVLFFAMVGYFIAAGVKIGSLLTSVVGVLLIPVLPLVYCGIFALLVMAFCRKVKILRNVDFVVGVAMVLFVGLFIYSFLKMDTINVDNYVSSLTNGENVFLNVMGAIFFTVPIFEKAMATGNVLWLLLYILVNAVAVFILFLLGNKFYLRGVYLVSSLGKSGRRRRRRGLKKAAAGGVTSDVVSGSKASADANADKSVEENEKLAEIENELASKESFPVTDKIKAYFIKELKTLYRTPAYKKYCINVNFIWPILIVALFYLPSTKDTIAQFGEMYQTGYVASDLIMLMAVIMIGFFATAMNSIASTSFTREGAHFSFIKYVPIDYKKQIAIKSWVSNLISGITVLVSTIVLCVMMKSGILYSIYYVIIALISMDICTHIGILLDSTHPSLDWEDEYGALRGNLSVFFSMAIAILIAGIMCLIGFLFFKFTTIRTGPIYLMYFAIILITDLQIRRTSVAAANKNISEY